MTFLELIDLASERFGASVVSANDEFFAPRDNLIKAGPPVWREGEYTDRGKWMDGWETRRRRDASASSGNPDGTERYDWCVIRLGARGIVRGVDVETTHFSGNYPEACAIDVSDRLDGKAGGGDPRGGAAGGGGGGTEWREILGRTPLEGDAHNLFAVEQAPIATHLRLRIYPDGGVARLRAHGEVIADWERLATRGEVDLAAAEHGGLVVGSSDMFFGSRHNLILPGEARHIGDGWETRRRRGPGHDWTVIKLATRGTIHRVEVDTRHFKGNAPGACSLEATDGSPERDDGDWRELLPRTPLEPDARQRFDHELGLRAIGVVTHVRFNIYPDGGVARLRLYGSPCISTR